MTKRHNLQRIYAIHFNNMTLRNCLNFVISFARRALMSIEMHLSLLFARRALTL